MLAGRCFDNTNGLYGILYFYNRGVLLTKRETNRIFCQPFIEKLVQESAQYNGHHQSDDDRSSYAHDIDVMAQEQISIYRRKNDNG